MKVGLAELWGRSNCVSVFPCFVCVGGESRVDSWSVHEAYWVLFLLVFERIRDMSKRYSQEFKDRAVRMLVDCLARGLTRGAPLVLGRLIVVIDNIR